MNKLEALQEVMTTLLKVKNEGRTLEMGGFGYGSSCNTVCCVAGWHTYFEGRETDCFSQVWVDTSSNFMWAVTIAVAGAGHGRRCMKVLRILFGQDRPNDIDKQIYVTRWFIRREEKLIEYNRIRAMPRKERRLLKLAA